MKVRIPSPLRSYTGQRTVVEAEGDHLTAVFNSLDDQFPGIKFRVIDEQGQIRKHMKVWVNDEPVRELGTRVQPTDEVTIMQALSGG